MALQVWITGIDGMKNQGLSGTRNLGSSTSNANGKIGTCQKITTNYDSNCTINPNTTDVTMCGWFKFNQSELQAALNNSGYNSSRTTPTGNLLGQNSYSGLALCYATNNQYSASGTINAINVFGAFRDSNSSSSCNSQSIPFDTWTYITLTWNHTTKLQTLYINGVLKSTSANTAVTSIPSWKFQINTGMVWGGNGPGCKIPFYFNDIRCYDNLLSEDEIHELSLGKVGHWKLNDYEISRSGLTSVTWNQQAPGSFTLANVVRDTSIITEEKYIVQTTQTTSARCLFKNGSTISTAHKAFVRVVFKSNFTNAPYLRYQYASGSYNSATTTYVPNKWCKIIKVSDGFVQGASTGILPNNNNFIQGEYISIADWVVVDLTQMFGSGNEPTAEQFDEMFPLWGAYLYDAGTVKNLTLPIPDISGNHYDLTKGGSGVLTLSTDTVRYDKSVFFNANSYLSSSFQSHIGTEDFTISCWAKISSASGGSSYQGIVQSKADSGASAGFGIYYNAQQKKLLWSTGDGSSAQEKWTNSTVDTILLDNWCHIVMVRNSSDAKKGYFYINGSRYDLAAVPTILNINSNNTISLGRNQGGLYYKGGLSDVRLYATALSADDVQKLYKLGNV